MRRPLACQFAVLIGGAAIFGLACWATGVPVVIGSALGAPVGLGLAAFAMWAVPL